MDTPNIQLGELIEKGQNSTTNAVKTTISDAASSASTQIGLKNETNAQAQTQAQDQVRQQGESTQVQTERTREMVRDFYSPSDDLTQNNVQAQAVTDEQQLASVRQKLHQELHDKTYYEPLFAYEHNLNKTESKVEKLEREKQQEMQELEQKEAEKPPSLAVQRLQTHVEAHPGIAG